MNANFQILLGIIAVTQSLLLPGLLILKVINFKGSFIQKIVYTAALSLVSNYIFVVVLVVLGIYKQWVVISIFLFESTYAVWLFRESLGQSLFEYISTLWKNFIGALQDLFDTWMQITSISDVIKSLFSFIAFTLSLALLWWSIKLMSHYAGTIFDSWDAIVSWNRWAVSWANGEFPLNTRNYPQLIPANYSLSYVFMASTEIQFFAKFLVLPTAFFLLLMPFDLGLQTKKSGFFLGTILIYLLLKKFLIIELTNGYVDGVMAFFSLLVVYTLIKLSFAERETEKNHLLFLGFFFAGSAAVVKQPGVYLFLLFPIWLYFGIFRQTHLQDWQQHKKLLVCSFAVSAFLAIPWYVYKQLVIFFGNDRVGITELLEASANNNYNVGWQQQIIDTISHFEIYLVLFPLILLAFFLLKPLYRWLVITLILPYPILWALIASYDTRNLSIFIPIFGLVAGISFQKLLDWILSLWDFGKLKTWTLALILAIALALGLVAKFPNTVLKEKQFTLQSQLFSARKNAMLYDLVEREGTDITIMTNYPMRFLPGFEEVELYDNYKNYDTFIGKLENVQVDYLFVPEDVFIEPRIKDYIDQKTAAGAYELIYEDKSWKYYKLLKVVR